MKRILQITPGLYVNGASLIARNIGLYRDPEKYEIDYLTFSDVVDTYEHQLLEAGCRVFHAPVSGRRWKHYLQMYHALRKQMLDFKYDAVHAHTMFQCGIVLLAAMRSGVQIRIAHSHNSGKTRRSVLSIPYEIVMRWLILRCANELIACGEEAGRFLFGKRAFENRCHVIKNRIEIEKYRFNKQDREAIRREMGLEDRFVIGCIGRLAEVKNHMFLVNLLPEVLKERENSVLVIAGEGEKRSALKSRAHELGIQEHVILTGTIDWVQRILNAFDVFVLPSLFEGMALAKIEAQANGLHCIISEHVPMDDVNLEQTTMIPLAQEAAWVNAICTSGRVSMQNMTRNMYSCKGSFHDMMQELYSCYEPKNNEMARKSYEQ